MLLVAALAGCSAGSSSGSTDGSSGSSASGAAASVTASAPTSTASATPEPTNDALAALEGLRTTDPASLKRCKAAAKSTGIAETAVIGTKPSTVKDALAAGVERSGKTAYTAAVLALPPSEAVTVCVLDGKAVLKWAEADGFTPKAGVVYPKVVVWVVVHDANGSSFFLSGTGE